MGVALTVRFEPFGLEVDATAGETILEVAARAGITIEATCAGRGTCGSCAVRVLDGSPGPVRPAERAVELPRGVVLACLTEVAGPLVVRPLKASITRHRQDE